MNHPIVPLSFIILVVALIYFADCLSRETPESVFKRAGGWCIGISIAKSVAMLLYEINVLSQNTFLPGLTEKFINTAPNLYSVCYTLLSFAFGVFCIVIAKQNADRLQNGIYFIITAAYSVLTIIMLVNMRSTEVAMLVASFALFVGLARQRKDINAAQTRE